MTIQSFIYSNLKGLIEINTLGPNGSFYYKVQRPISINMSNFACKIAFYDIDGFLIYHRKDAFAHWLKPWQKIELVKWSSKGNMVYFYEYCRNIIYESVFMNLREKYCYRINEMNNNFEIVNALDLKDREFNEEVVIGRLEDLGLPRRELIKDQLSKRNIVDKLLDRNKWRP
jgi:hypothetical protein